MERIERIEGSAEVELVVGRAGEADDVRLGSCSVRVAHKGLRGAVVVPIVLVVMSIRTNDVVVLVVVIPEEGVGVGLVCAALGRIVEDGLKDVSSCRTASTELAQPVLMSDGVVLIEVTYLTLLVRCHEFYLKRQADSFPTLDSVDIVVGRALVPHTLAGSEGIGHGRIEVLTVDEEVVVGSGVSRSVLNHGVAEDDGSILRGNGAVVALVFHIACACLATLGIGGISERSHDGRVGLRDGIVVVAG